MKAVHCPKCCTTMCLDDRAPVWQPCIVCMDWQMDHAMIRAYVQDAAAKGRAYWKAQAFPPREFLRSR